VEPRPDRQGRAAPGVGPRLRSRRPTLLSQLSSHGRGLVRRRLRSRGLTARAGQPPVLGRDSIGAAQLSSASRAGAGGGSQAATLESRPDSQGWVGAQVGPRLQSRRPTLLSQPGSQGRGLVRRRLWSRGLTARAGQPPVLGRDSVVAAQLSSASRAGAGGGSQAATMESRPDSQGRAAPGVGPRLRSRRPTLLSQPGRRGRG
jgi:hypothetical protein